MCKTLQTEKKTKKISGKSRGTALRALLLAFFSIFAMHEIQAQCTCAGNLVLNPSFESGTSNWSSSGGNLSAGGGAVNCGSFSGDFQITNNSNNWVTQTIASGTIPAGSTINLSVFAGTHNNSFYHEVKVMYYNSSWGWISQTAVEVNKVLSASPVGPQLYNITSTVPADVNRPYRYKYTVINNQLKRTRSVRVFLCLIGRVKPRYQGLQKSQYMGSSYFLSFGYNSSREYAHF
jgi:hypothetical protein